MNTNPHLSILIPWREREELALTLLANTPIFEAHDTEVIVLNCGGSSSRVHELMAGSGLRTLRHIDIPVEHFNKSLALNVGIYVSRAELVMVLDTDIVLLSDIYAESDALGSGGSFTTVEWVHESEPSGLANLDRTGAPAYVTDLVRSTFLEFSLKDGKQVTYQLAHGDLIAGKRAGPGLLFARKSDLLAINGYNSELNTWGWEDDDVLFRLQCLRGLQRMQKGSALHLSHDDGRRVLNQSANDSDRQNFLKCWQNYKQGNFLGTYSSDAESMKGGIEEIAIDGGTEEASEVCVQSNPHDIPYFESGPLFCGAEDGLTIEHRPDWSKRISSIDQLLLEATLKKERLRDCSILHIGIGNSGFAQRFSPYVRHITGVTVDHAEFAVASSFALRNYSPVICNKYSRNLVRALPLRGYDCIVDNNIASFACCQLHLKTVIDNYASLLLPGGSALTIQTGMDWSATDPCWRLTGSDLARLAGDVGLTVTKSRHGVYALRKG
ncbi:MAG: glycosyltransferase family 2 protein [Acidobacteriaceae bacterium]|nr:glycosyltransferase family 2 protein [Acidobacteriaceae bacterium]